MLRLWKRLSNCCLGLLIRSILTAAGKMGRWGWLSAYIVTTSKGRYPATLDAECIEK
jgi:hypothetical protein